MKEPKIVSHLFIFLFLTLCLAARCSAESGIAPLVVHLENSQKTASIVVENTTDQPRDIDIKVQSEDACTGHVGTTGGGTLELVYANPNHFLLDGGERQVVQFASYTTFNPGKREYRTFFVIESRTIQDSISEENSTDILPATLSLIFRVGVEIKFRPSSDARIVIREIVETTLPKNLMLALHRYANGVFFENVLVKFRNQYGYVAAWFERKVARQAMRYTIDLASIPPGMYTTEIQLRTTGEGNHEDEGFQAPEALQDIALHLP